GEVMRQSNWLVAPTVGEKFFFSSHALAAGLPRSTLTRGTSGAPTASVRHPGASPSNLVFVVDDYGRPPFAGSNGRTASSAAKPCEIWASRYRRTSPFTRIS